VWGREDYAYIQLLHFYPADSEFKVVFRVLLPDADTFHAHFFQFCGAYR
jgi:hypothetical protein